MTDPLALRYPGRFIILGKDAGAYVAIYGATGRSASSLARRFVRHEDGIYMVAVDDTVSKEAKPELFEYPAVKFFENGIVVANGRHIENLSRLDERDARKQLSFALSEEAYEPDNEKTPRITGVLLADKNGIEGALHIARIAPDGIDRSSWSAALTEGEGEFVSTYRGEDLRPTPSFSGNPLPVPLVFGSAEKAARGVFDSFAPPAGEPDYRVGVVAVYFASGATPDIAIVNRLD